MRARPDIPATRAVQPGHDARSRIVHATPAGKALRTEAQRAWKRAQSALNERLGIERVAALHGLLDACMALLGPEAHDAAADEPQRRRKGSAHG